MNTIRFRFALAFVASPAALLTACAPPAPPPAAEVVKPVIQHDPGLAVRAIRSAGDGLDSAVQVQPLRDAAIDGFLKKARDAEAARDYSTATTAANNALKLAPEAPDILQYLAELNVEQSRWTEAEQLATRSFTLGPRVGSLCARNWQTVVEARLALGDDATVKQAQLRLKECRVPPRLRM